MEPLSQTQIIARTGTKVFERGADYWRSGAVRSLVKRGKSLHAKVRGSELYRVSIRWGEHGEVEADCTCPYAEDYGDWCKHIVAVLLSFEGEETEEQPLIEELLEPFTRDQLVELLVELSGRNWAIYEEIVSVITGEEPEEDDEDEWGR